MGGLPSLYRLVSEGQLPEPIRLGGRVLWSEEEIDAHLASLKQEAVA